MTSIVNHILLLFIAWIFILRCSIAQDCTTNGRQAGVLPIDRANDTASAGDEKRLYIMKSEGGISCYGVITHWSFYKSASCEEMDFEVYRPDDPLSPAEYILVGQNKYDPVVDNCQPREGKVDLYISYLQQIPVYPGDIIAWRQNTTTTTPGAYMIKYDENVKDDVIFWDNCEPAIGEDAAIVCSNDQNIDRVFSLQANLLKGDPPTFSNLPQTIEVYENEAVDTEILVIYAQHISNLNTPFASNVIELAVPLILTLDSSITDFNLTQIAPSGIGADHIYQGILTILQPLDYETTPVYNIPVSVEGLEVTTTQYLTVNVLDANDPHAIINLPNSINISAATAKSGDIIFQVNVDNPGSNPFPMIYYIDTITQYDSPNDPSPPFAIDRNTGEVTVTMDLADWWEIETYYLNISVTDGIHNDGPHTLIVYVYDLRPAPYIENLAATIEVFEDAAGGTMVYKVEVTAPDPSTVVFALEDYNHNFYIDSKTGKVWLVQTPTLDYVHVAARYHNLTILVNDDLREASNNGEVLTIGILWVNQPPAFVPSEYWITIPEGCDNVSGCISLPWLLTDLLLYPEDRDANSSLQGDFITCEILPGFADDHFEFEDPLVCTKLEQIKNLDVDLTPEYSSINLTTRIYDNYGLANTGKVYITVYDINDNAPHFDPNSYSEVIAENTPGGKSLFTVSATDRDSGINAEFRFSVEDNNGNNNPSGRYYFEVDSITGVVSTKHPVDYEALAAGHKYIDFFIQATDLGIDPGSLSSLASARVVISDVNDNAPIFNCSLRPGLDEPVDPDYECFYNMEVKSIALKQTYIWELIATDEDIITPDPKFYKLVPENHLDLHYDSGNITTAVDKLYNNHKYVIYAHSTDEGVPELISTPSVIRIESYSMSEYAVEITVQLTGSADPCATFDQGEFIQATREYITLEKEKSWFVKQEGLQVECSADRVLIHIYALRDNSTYLYKNLENRKHFVPTRYELLKPLRKTVLGKPHDDYKEFMEQKGFDVILVMPWRQIWLIDTLPGLIVLLLMMLAFIAFWIALAVCCCKKHGVCCFKKKPPVELDEQALHKPATPKEKRRPVTASTVHSLIYDQTQHQ